MAEQKAPNSPPGWQGKIIIKSGMSAKAKYALIDEKCIKIADKETKEPSLIINKENIVSIVPPSFDFLDSFFRGYRGFTLRYTENNKENEIAFYPAGFGAWVNNKELPRFAEALAPLATNNSDEIRKAKTLTSKQAPMAVTGCLIGIVLWFFFGWLGTFIILIGTSIAYKLYKNLNVEKWLKIVLALLIVAVSFAIAIGIQVAVFVGRYGKGY